MPRLTALTNRRPQIVFRLGLPSRTFGSGAFKGVVALSVREIGEVIFADGFRQIRKMFLSTLTFAA
jgi:hypothetical protein